MTKRSLVALFVAAVSCAVSAQEYGHEQFAYQEPLYVPRWSTPYLPQDTMPEACRNPEVEAYIRDWEAGRIDFLTIRPWATFGRTSPTLPL